MLARAGTGPVRRASRTPRPDPAAEERPGTIHARTNESLSGQPPVPLPPPARAHVLPWVAAASCLLAAAVVGQSDLARLACRWLLQPVLPDAAEGTVRLLLAATAGLVAVLAVARRRPGGWLDRPDAGYLLLGCIAFAHGLALFALFGYLERLDLPWQAAGHHCAGATCLSQGLLAGGAGASGLATVLQALPGGLHEGGPVIATHVPSMERWAIGLLLVAGLASALAAAPGIARRHGWHPVAIVLFAGAAFGSLGSVVEGGVFAPWLPPSALMLLLFAAARDTDHLRRLVRRHWPAAAALLAAWAGAVAWVAGEGRYMALYGFAAVAVPGALGLLCWAWRDRLDPRARRVALSAGLACLLPGYAIDAWTGTGLLLRPLPDEARIVVTDAAGRTAHDASDALRGATPLAVYRRFGDDPLRPRRVLIEARPAASVAGGAGPGGASARELTFALRFIEGRPAAAASPEGLYSLLGAERSRERTNTAVFVFRTASPLIPPFFATPDTRLARNNFAVHLHLVAAALRAQGLESFVLMPLLDPGDRDLFLPTRRRGAG